MSLETLQNFMLKAFLSTLESDAVFAVKLCISIFMDSLHCSIDGWQSGSLENAKGLLMALNSVSSVLKNASSKTSPYSFREWKNTVAFPYRMTDESLKNICLCLKYNHTKFI